jgi:hypothetical protein
MCTWMTNGSDALSGQDGYHNHLPQSTHIHREDLIDRAVGDNKILVRESELLTLLHQVDRLLARPFISARLVMKVPVRALKDRVRLDQMVKSQVSMELLLVPATREGRSSTGTPFIAR